MRTTLILALAAVCLVGCKRAGSGKTDLTQSGDLTPMGINRSIMVGDLRLRVASAAINTTIQNVRQEGLGVTLLGKNISTSTPFVYDRWGRFDEPDGATLVDEHGQRYRALKIKLPEGMAGVPNNKPFQPNEERYEFLLFEAPAANADLFELTLPKPPTADKPIVFRFKRFEVK